MELLKEIKQRKSPVVFKAKQVTKEQLELLIEAARWAPSGFNKQPWNYVFVSKKDKSRKALEQSLMLGNGWAKKAPYLVVVFSDPKSTPSANDVDYTIYDSALSVMNFVLQAEHMGLAVHQMGGFFGGKVKKAVGLANEFKPLVVMAIGYADSSKTVMDKLNEQLRKKLARPRTRKNPEENFFFGKYFKK